MLCRHETRLFEKPSREECKGLHSANYDKVCVCMHACMHACVYVDCSRMVRQSFHASNSDCTVPLTLKSLNFFLPPFLPSFSPSQLDEDGLISPGVPVAGDDAIVGCTIQINAAASSAQSGPIKYEKRDKSKFLRSTETGVVDSVMITNNDQGNRFVKVRVRSVRIPQVGLD
jgi:hypothetical protein